MEERLKYMIQHGGNDGYAAQVQKQKVIGGVLNELAGEDFVDNRDVEHLNLNPTE